MPSPKKKKRPIELVWDPDSMTMMGRELPLTKEEKLQAFDALRMQGLTVDLALRRRDAAKEAAKEAKAALQREYDRLLELSRNDPQGQLFPVTEEEIRDANRRAMRPPDPKPEKPKDDKPKDEQGEEPDDQAA